MVPPRWMPIASSAFAQGEIDHKMDELNELRVLGVKQTSSSNTVLQPNLDQSNCHKWWNQIIDDL